MKRHRGTTPETANTNWREGETHQVAADEARKDGLANFMIHGKYMRSADANAWTGWDLGMRGVPTGNDDVSKV